MKANVPNGTNGGLYPGHNATKMAKDQCPGMDTTNTERMVVTMTTFRVIGLVDENGLNAETDLGTFETKDQAQACADSFKGSWVVLGTRIETVETVDENSLQDALQLIASTLEDRYINYLGDDDDESSKLMAAGWDFATICGVLGFNADNPYAIRPRTFEDDEAEKDKREAEMYWSRMEEE